jgi:hypothetical protein
MATKHKAVQALEINASLIGALFTEQNDTHIRVFCFYLNGSTSEFTVPADSNQESLHHLFSRLDMVDQCTSVILEKIVQGRIYVEHEGRLVSYTLISTAGSSVPPITPDLCNLPWRRVWSSTEAEVLELGAPGKSIHCFAVRSHVNDVEATSIYRSSNAFIAPTVTRRVGLPGATLAIAVSAAVAVLAVGGWFAASQLLRASPVPVQARTLAPMQTSLPNLRAHVLHEQKITGPFTTQELVKMSAEGSLPRTALLRAEGSSEWVSYDQLLLPTTTVTALAQ